MATTIVPKGSSLTALYVNRSFDVSFDISSVFTVAGASLQTCNSYSGLTPYLFSNGSNFKGTFTSAGFKQYLQTDAIFPTNDRAVWSVIPNTISGSGNLVLDSSGRIYFGDNTGGRILRTNLTGSYEVFAGQTSLGYTNGNRLTTATFTNPQGMAFDASGNMYVGEFRNIRKIAPDGTVSTFAGSVTGAAGYADGSGNNCYFRYVGGLRIDDSGNLIAVDSDNHAIRRVTIPDAIVTTIAGGGTAPTWPSGLGSTGASGFTNATGTAARFTFPNQFTFTTSGELLVMDPNNNRVRHVNRPTTVVTTYAGSGSAITIDGTRATAGFATPVGIDRDASDTVYVSEFNGYVIRRISGDSVTTFAGKAGDPRTIDGNLTTARFYIPEAIRYSGDTLYVRERNGRLRAITAPTEVSPFTNRPAGYTILATQSYPITVNSRIDVCWTSVGGLLPLYKFEPFDASFTANRCGGETNDTLTYSTTSTELIGYMSGTGTSNVLFRGSNGPSVAYTYPLTLSVRAISNLEVVDDVSTTVTIGTARIIYSPCNASLVFYRNEPSPAPVFSLVASDASLIYSGTSLPAGLSFTRTGARSFALTGTPTVQTIASNYTILAFDTRSRTYATQVSMVVNPERLILDVSGSLTQTGVLDTAPIEPITFTARFPPYTAYRAMRYSWTPPPPIGLEFRDISGVAIPGSTYSVDTTRDASFTMTLAGTISPSYLRTLAENNISNYSITLTGTRTSPLPSLSPSLPRTITLRFGETIFFPSALSNVPPLFVGLTVSNYFYTAKTYFATTDTSITDIAVTDGFLPDGLVGTFTSNLQRFDISGTPTNAATYPFTLTATNGNGITASLSVAPVISNDSISITALDGTSFTFIQSRNLSNAKTGFYPYPIRFSVASASGCNVTVAGTNLPTGVTLVSNAGTYDLSGRPTAAAGASTATLTANAAATGVSAATTFAYSVSAETFFFPSPTFAFTQNVPITSVQIDVSTLSENPVTRFSSPNIPAALQITNTGLISGTLQGDTSGTFDVTAFTAYSSGTKTYSYATTPDQVLLQPSVYTTVTAPGCNVSIPINGYSLSALTVSNYRFQSAFPYGLTVNSTTGLLSGTLASSLPASTTFTVLGSAGTVNGSLTGTMATTNLTTNRAQVIEIQEQSNLRVYYSDDIGVNWTLAVSSNSLVAGRVGVNNVDTYLIPTSSDIVLRSSTGSGYSPVSLGQSAYSPLMTGVAHDSATSTWWIGGTLSNGSRSVRVFKSLDDGATWDSGTTVAGVQDRSGNADPGAGVYDAYLYGGVDLAYESGVLLLGGQQITRSTDGGATWSTRPSSLLEVARFSLDQGTVWLAVGSSLYSSTTNNTYTAAATTIVYSLDQGLTWTNASGGFNMNAYEVVYGDGVWLASGLDWTGSAFVQRIRYSFDGVTWAILTSVPQITYGTTLDVRPLGGLGTIGYDQSTWVILRTPDDGTAIRYSHPADTPIDSGWTTTTITGEFPGIDVGSRFSSYVVQTINPGDDITTITFPLPNDGPTFTSPAQTTYVVWQYMPLPTISFTATGTAPISYFASSLPVGLTWNSTTHSISGACMQTGTQSFTVYAVDGAGGVTARTIILICDVPRIVKKQTGAGAYTALVRDYTEVAAAINARDTRVNPTEEAALGSFASPYAPDVVTPSNCPC